MSTARDQIIQSTCELLELQGYHATGINQIIQHSQSPKGSLYYYFPGGKEELAIEAVQHAGAIVLARIRENLTQTEDPAEAIGRFICKIAFHVERSGYRAGGPITTVAMETVSTNDALRSACSEIYTAWRGAFADKLAQKFEPERADRLAGFVLAAIEGGIILARTEKSPAPLDAVAQELACFLKSIHSHTGAG